MAIATRNLNSGDDILIKGSHLSSRNNLCSMRIIPPSRHLPLDPKPQEQGRSIVEDVVVDQSLSVPLPEFAEDNKIKKLDSEETEVVAEISKDEKGQAEKEGRELGEAVVPPVPVSAVVPPEVTHDSDANITGEESWSDHKVM